MERLLDQPRTDPKRGDMRLNTDNLMNVMTMF